MRTYDEQEAKKLKAEPWQLDLLKMNPSYVFWGNDEDYMLSSGLWSKPLKFNNIDEMFELNELNECVNFYFEVTRKSEKCPTCQGGGLNLPTTALEKAWYDFDETGNRWCDSLTEVEVEALMKAGRLRGELTDFRGYYDTEKDTWVMWNDKGELVPCEKPEFPLPEEVNNWAKTGFGHDAINRSICVRARAEHLGVWEYCPTCEGEGEVFTEDFATVSLQLWILHPRKGASRGVRIHNIKESDLPKVYELLRTAKQRNNDRFMGV